jgi:N-alpha-acetyltransferase 15/16, NatA auxiliary subunit
MSSNNNNSSNGGGGSNSNDNPQAGQGRPLPKKEADLFKALVKQYESKQYKKAIKAADTILKKYPNHGETLVMKGLTVYYSSPDRKEEAHNCVKLGLRNDMRYVLHQQ